MKEKKVGVITLNYNQNDYTVDCINSLLKSDYLNYQIILIDNGSSEHNFKSLRKSLPEDSKLSILRLDNNYGYVGGINYGLEIVKKIDCDYCLIMNNDTLIDAQAIKELVHTSEKYKGKAIVSGKVYNYDEKDTLQYIGQAFDAKGMLNQKSYIKGGREKDIGQYDQEIEMGMLDDIFWMLSREIYNEIGLYSEYFFLYGEQNDYALRAIKKGYKLIYTPKAKLWHKGGITTANGNKKNSPKINYWLVTSLLKLSVLHLSKEQQKVFYREYLTRKILKLMFLTVINPKDYINLKSFYFAIRDFNYWKRIKHRDNGYNPFS